ncbi:serine hydrolase [Amycolatopsis sp. YIM 10]|uniref:serine hydrolase domain-containing protein n=1 Tax=Amycolatopsis sp. YIM 10 TaxID=2653857 RepID=UPI0012901E29|nr:serine hydrolase domain-containing protein [Amycolatopsis sp. YIM 10]
MNTSTRNTSTRNKASLRRGFRRTALAVAVLTGVATSTVVAAPRATAAHDRPELRQAIQEFVDAGYAGIQLRVHDERGEWAGSAGVRKLGGTAKPPTNGHFRIGSTTKTFVATLVLQLVADGKLGLDSPVAGHLPGFGLNPEITVRMLLGHTSGLPDFVADPVVPGIPWQGEEWVANRFHTHQPEDLVRLALTGPPRFAPGTSWSYSNTNYVLAKLLIEKITGRPYGEEMKRRIFQPLGLADTVVPGAWSGMPSPYAHAYYRYLDDGQWKTIDVTRQNPSWISAAGEMISTTEDLHKFFSALQKGELVPAPLLAEMRETHPDSAGFFGRYGLGQYVLDTGADCAGPVLNHNGSNNGYGALMYSTPDGSKTMTASITTGDAPINQAEVFPAELKKLLDVVFCGG